MLKKLNKDNKGFTIIEVLIVLAIAGLIMLIVFLAIPALQRNQRNNARNSEGSRISASVSECLANRNGITGSCLTEAAINNLPAGRQQLSGTTLFSNTSTSPGTATTEVATVWFGAACSADGTSASHSASTPRAFAVQYVLENNINRCIGSEK